MSDKALVTVQSEDGPPTLSAAARLLGVGLDAVDATYGVVLIDPKRGLYAVQVDAAQLPSSGSSDDEYRGPFSNPRIETFGPRRSADDPAAKTKR